MGPCGGGKAKGRSVFENRSEMNSKLSVEMRVFEFVMTLLFGTVILGALARVQRLASLALRLA